MKETARDWMRKADLRRRISSFLPDLLRSWLTGSSDLRRIEKNRNFLQGLLVHVEDRHRQLEGETRPVVKRIIDGREEALPVSILKIRPPWSDRVPQALDIPGMITDEEARYYLWLGEYYRGKGSVVELGPWLGLSTVRILQGLLPNPAFRDRVMPVFDDFVWRASFMNNYVKPSMAMKDGEDFLPLFRTCTAEYSAHIDARPRAIQRQACNAHLPAISWEGEPVEILYVDCGRAFLENQAWLDLFSPGFIKDVTLVVMQDWRTHREVPRRPYNQTLQFSESLGARWEMVHETAGGGIATFLWRG